jgi:hypothetical protein
MFQSNPRRPKLALCSCDLFKFNIIIIIGLGLPPIMIERAGLPKITPQIELIPEKLQSPSITINSIGDLLPSFQAIGYFGTFTCIASFFCYAPIYKKIYPDT